MPSSCAQAISALVFATLLGSGFSGGFQVAAVQLETEPLIVMPTDNVTRDRLDAEAALQARSQCTWVSNGDFKGNDFASYPSPSPSDCCSKCAADTRCAAWSLYQQVCYLKDWADQNTFQNLEGCSTGFPGDHTDWLGSHNHARRQVNRNLPDLTWSDNIAKRVKAWTDWLRDNNDCHIKHGGHDNEGQNLEEFGWVATDATVPNHAVADWVSEGESFVCGSGTYDHYTQVVWKDTTQVGCACTVCPLVDRTVCGCNYSPPGNVVGSDPYPC